MDLEDDLPSDFPTPLFWRFWRLSCLRISSNLMICFFCQEARRCSNGDKHCCPLCYHLLWLSWKDYLDSSTQCMFSILQMICWWYLWHLDWYISQVGALEIHSPFQESLLESNWSCLKSWFSWFDFRN
jgi:hypothetical protein